MTSEQLELVTAAVDGELSATEARAFRQLLSASPEAHALFVKLKADSDCLRALPLATPPADLRAKIMARIAATTPVPTVAPAKPKPAVHATHPTQPPAVAQRVSSSWLPIAIAAGLMLCITAGSFAFFNSQSTPSKSTAAKNQWSNALPAVQSAPSFVPSPTAPSPRDTTPPDANAVARTDVSPVPSLPDHKLVMPESVAIAPEPRAIEPDLVGARPLPPLPPFNFVEARVPFLRTVAELEDRRQELTDELRRDSAYRFDLFVRDSARGVEVFQNAAKVSGLTTFTDATALDRLKKKQVSSVVIYTESLTPAELAALFAQVSAEDAKFTPRICDSLHVASAVRSDELDLRATLGFDPGLYKRPQTSSGSKPSDKPVSAATIASVVKSVTNAGEKTAVLMTWHPATARTNPLMSVELKQFQSKRGDRKPAAIPAIIVIRPVG